ncbi:MAG: TonB-dependent receptor [Bacteroidaceae bacterium]|nr:TonB-dependent receptor [Bacteroidaceae bacterium]
MNRKIIHLFVFLFMLIVPQSFWAQSFVVKGQVTSHEDNEPLIGVAIMQEGTTNGVVTDFDGNYAIELKGVDKAVLVFSYIGMKTQLHTVNNSTGILDIVMQSDAEVMEEVVVVAYGTRKKGTIAGSVSTVKSDKVANVPAAGFDQALQGQTPGLTVLSNSGEPSKAATFQIRGTNSINSGTAPLFILDGVPITSSDFNTISPSDIESISVLKDASSTSIYGARAANGVVVITTKRGTAMDKAKVVLRTQVGFSELAGNNWTLMNTAERIQFEQELGLDKGQDYDKLRLTDVNWQEAVFNDRAMLQNYDLSISRATDKLNYFVSGSFYDQDGIAQGSTFRRYNLRANADVKASNWLKVGTNSMVAYEEVQQAEDGQYALYTPISACRFMLPYWNPYREDGSIASSKDGSWTGTTYNPVEWMENNPVLNKKYKALTVLYAEITPIENLTIRSQFGVDYSHSTADMKSYPSFPGNNGIGNVGRSSYDMMSLTITNTANYRFNLKDKHSFNVMLGQEGVDYRSEGFQVVTSGQNNDFLTDLASGTRASMWSNSFSSYSYLSFFGRGEYSFDDRFYADFSIRADASSRFGKNGRWGTFWSVGLMWNLKQEEFMKRFDWLTTAQIAFSTGTSGNSEIPNYDHLELVGGGANYMGTAGIAPISEGNPDLGWEQLWATNLAFHLGFFNRVNVDLELYNKRTSNMLMLVPQSYSNNGFGSRWDNVGVMINRGAELAVNADVIRTRDFTWNVNANVSYNKNEITELYNGLSEYEIAGTSTKLVVGHSVGEFYTNRYAGVNPANGDALWYTKEGELTTEYNESDKVMVGKNYIAPWQGGFGTTLSWKGFSLNAQFSWVADRWMFNNDRFFEESNGLYTVYNQSRRLLYDRWKKPGDVTDIPRYGITPQMDSRFLEDASFLRLKNLTLGYAVPQNWLEKTHFFDSARIYVQGQNLLTFTKFSGIDPESSSNIYAAQYPMSRQLTLGIELSF